MADAVLQRIAAAYSELRGATRLASSRVSASDYLAYLELRQRMNEGLSEAEQRGMLEDLQDLLRSSPQFVPGHLLRADLARSLFTSTSDPADWKAAMDAVEAAAGAAPDDPRPKLRRINLLLEDRQIEPARLSLQRLRQRVPGHPEVPYLLSKLADLEGDLEKARHELQSAADQYPSWQNLYRLASVELRDGLVDRARKHLQTASEVSPSNPWTLRNLGALELTEGRLEQAEAIFVHLLDLDPQAAPPRINLGLVRLLSGRFADAADDFSTVLAANPGDVVARINLADSLLSANETEAAERAYRQALNDLGDDQLSPADRMLRAQALARLGEYKKAVRITQETALRNPENVNVLYGASLVYSLADDRTSALLAAEQAVAGGLHPVWFRIRGFEKMRDDPEFQRLLEAATESR